MIIPTPKEARAAKSALASTSDHDAIMAEKALSECWRNWNDGPEHIREVVLFGFLMGLKCRNMYKEK